MSVTLTGTSGATQILADYATGLTLDAIPPATVEHAKMALLDLIGIAVRARFDADSSPAIARTVESLAPAGGDARAIGHDRAFPAQYAALLNGAYAHTLDFDDTHVSSSLHPGAPVIPAALAAAQIGRCSGARLIAAIVAGYDVTVRLAEALGAARHYARGFHPTATCGTFGAAAAVASVSGSPAGVLVNAFGIAGSQAAGSLQFLANGAWNKRVHVGFAAHNGLIAHRFAEAGVIGAADAFEGRHGFLRGYTDGPEPERATDRLGHAYAIDETAFKPYPSCRYMHAAIDELKALVKEYALRPDDVERVTIALPRVGLELVGYPETYKRLPRSVVDGQFSMYFVAAAVLLTGGFTWDEYKLLGDPRIAHLIERIDLEEDPSLEALGQSMAAIVRVRAHGRTHERRNLIPSGEPEKPLGWSGIIDKFESLAGIAYDAPRRAAIVADVRGLEDLTDVSALTARLGA